MPGMETFLLLTFSFPFTRSKSWAFWKLLRLLTCAWKLVMFSPYWIPRRHISFLSLSLTLASSPRYGFWLPPSILHPRPSHQLTRSHPFLWNCCSHSHWTCLRFHRLSIFHYCVSLGMVWAMSPRIHMLILKTLCLRMWQYLDTRSYSRVLVRWFL